MLWLPSSCPFAAMSSQASGVVHQTGYVRIEGHSQSLGVPQGSDDIVVTGQGVVVADRIQHREPRGARKILIYLS